MRNKRRLPVTRLTVCRQLVVFHFLLQCRGLGEMLSQVPTSSRWKGDYTLMTKQMKANNKEEENSRIEIWNL